MVLLAVALITNAVSATTFYWDANAVGDWDDDLNWVNEFGEPFTKPNGIYEVKIKHASRIKS